MMLTPGPPFPHAAARAPSNAVTFVELRAARLMDVRGLLWKLEYIGMGAGYFWSDRFSGWTIGAEVSLAPLTDQVGLQRGERRRA